MRVVHVVPTPFGPDSLLGGGERYPLELARALAPFVETDIVTFSSKPSLRIDPAGLRIRALRPLTRWRGHPAQPFAPQLMKAIRTFDVVHTHHTKSLPSQMAGLAARLYRRSVVTTDHGLAGVDWGGLLQQLFGRFLLVSSYSARVVGAPTGRTTVIYGGADIEKFKPDPLERRSGVLFVGRITPHKGIDRLIQALPAGAHLRIIGSAGHDRRLPEREYPILLRRLAAGRLVEFVGPVADAHLAVAYRQAAVTVLPSVEHTCYGRRVPVSELLGLTVLEAMASGTPVICSRIGGLPEIVHDGVTGLLVEPGNVEELRERLSQLLADASLRARLGRNARELVVSNFTWQACAERCLGAYEQLVESRMPMRP